MSDELKDVIIQCTHMNPDERPTTAQLLEHPFFRKSCAPADIAPYAAKADREVDRSYLDEVEH